MNIIKYLKAISGGTRLRLLFLLLHYELNVNEVVAVVEMIQSRVSRHLKILTESGLLQFRRDGGFVYYSAFTDEANGPVIRLVSDALADDPVCGADRDRAEALIRERKSRTKRFFEFVADTWEVRKHDVLGDLDLNRMIADRVGNCPVAADLGCGTGALPAALHGQVTTVIGVDSSPGMLEQARLKTAAMAGVNLRLGELEYLPMRDREAHCAVMNMVLHHISEPVKVLAEAHRILQPRGTFFVADFDKHNKVAVREKIGGSRFGFSQKEMEAWLAGAGFVPAGLERFAVNYGLTVNLFSARKQQ